MDLVTVYFDPIFVAVFGCKTGSHQGLLILSALSMVSNALALLCLRVAVSVRREKRDSSYG